MKVVKKISDLIIYNQSLGKEHVIGNIKIAFLKFEQNHPIFWNSIKYLKNTTNNGQLLKSIKFELYDEKVLNNNYDFVIIKKDNEIYYLYRKLDNFKIIRELKEYWDDKKGRENLIAMDVDLNWNCHELISEKIIDRLFFNEKLVELKIDDNKGSFEINLEDYLKGNF